MKTPTFVFGGAIALALATLHPAVATLDAPVDIDARGLSDSNAADNERARQERLLYFQSQPAILRYLLSSIEGRAILYRFWLFRQLYWRPVVPGSVAGDTPQTTPADGPAESILDELDDNESLPMAGLPGNRDSLRAFDAPENTPSPSILDEIEDSPKPAINRVTPPPVQER